MLWLQGWENAPRIVRACHRSWEVGNGGWKIVTLTRSNIGQFVSDRNICAAAGNLALPPEAYSDRLRIALLAQHGGVWADATTYCLRPLDSWLPNALVSGFFAFDRPAPDRLLSSWFLAAKRGNYIIQRWADRTIEYWRSRSDGDHYFWFHYLFSVEYERDIYFRLMYDSVPKISAEGPHYYLPQDEKLWAPVTERDRILIDGVHSPLLKLSHRLREGDYPVASVAEYLCMRLGT